jgi:hypothetical protein
MALVLKDRVRESSTTSGTGSITLAGAYTGYQSFATAIASGSTVYYTIRNTTAPNDGEWEVGVGTFTSPSTLSRDTVFSSSTGGTKVSFSTASTLEVFVTQPAEQALYTNEATGKVEANGNGSNTISFTNINTTNLTANTVTLTAGTITTNAANGTDITNKTYVDNLFSTGITYHDPVLVESPTALTATYNQPGGAGNGVGATLTNSGANVALSIDGVSLSNTARVLVYQQSNAVHNGVYTVTNAGAPDVPGPGAAWVLTRATDADTYGVGDPNKLGQGDAFFVQSGNTGAGETYILNTVGTITFGTTNLTFAQISSAQVYSAGTGLNLTNLAFSISNTAVTAAQYGNDGAVGQFTVNAQGQITNAANVSINASSISVGTLDNARTTAASANGASTIVLRDSNGSFNANVVTATTVNATTGNFTNITGNAVSLTDINASNITSGTISNARTTGSTSNSASTLVLRDANGSFGSNVITASLFSGDGSGINAINASNISSGTIANARTTASSSNGASTIVLRDSGGSFDANLVNAVSLSGNAATVTGINASNIASGTIANARTTASSSNGASTIVLRGASGEFAAGAITGTSFSGNGSAITAINATAITSGTLDNARTTAASANGASTIVARDAGGNFSANTITATTFSGAFSGGAITATDITDSSLTINRVTYAGTGGNLVDSANLVFLTQYNTGANPSLYSLNGMSVGTGTLSYPSVNTGIGFYSRGGTSMGGFLVQDGQGRLNQYWNAYTDSGLKYIVSGEASARYLMSVNSTTGGLHAWYGAPSGTAGGAISFTQMGQMTSGTGGSVWFSQRGTSSDFFMGTSGGVSIGNTTDPGATNLSVTGTIAGNGAPLTAINASNLSSGTVASARISGSYTGITGVGTLSAGVWQGTSISTTYTDAKVTSVNGSTGAVTVAAGQFFGSAAIKAIAYNANTIGENVTVTTGNNGLSAGPITISSGFTVTVQTGAVWVIV